MAEAKWGVPEEIGSQALARLDKKLSETYERFVQKYLT
jgi:hypothetical protein